MVPCHKASDKPVHTAEICSALGLVTNGALGAVDLCVMWLCRWSARTTKREEKTDCKYFRCAL